MAHRLFSFSMYFFGPLWLWMKSWVCVACSGLGFVLVGSGIAADSPCLDHFNFNFYFPFFFSCITLHREGIVGRWCALFCYQDFAFFFLLVAAWFCYIFVAGVCESGSLFTRPIRVSLFAVFAFLHFPICFSFRILSLLFYHSSLFSSMLVFAVTMS